MVMRVLTIVMYAIFGMLGSALVASAHQPRLTTATETRVALPEVSQAFYATLDGSPHVYTIRESAPFDLEVEVTLPQTVGPRTDVTVEVVRASDGTAVTMLDGPAHTWTPMWEPFGRSWYFSGPTFRSRVPAGEYRITVRTPDNLGRYVLVVGSIEAFTLAETVHAVRLIPRLKREFFDESPAGFLLSPMGAPYAGILVLGGAYLGVLGRQILRRLPVLGNRRAVRNMGLPDRIARLAIGVGLAVWAFTTTWDPITLVIAGFTLYEGLSRWCVLHAAVGRNTCPA